MTHKLIFLDIDGVLNSYRSAIAYGGYGTSTDAQWDPVAVAMLRRLVEAADAKIVISSSWRINDSLADFHEMFNQYGWDTTNIIIGMTPSLNGSTPRGLEIYTWLQYNCEYTFADYIIIDDSADILEDQKSVHIRPSLHVGLSFEDILKAEALFGCQIIPDPVINMMEENTPS